MKKSKKVAATLAKKEQPVEVRMEKPVISQNEHGVDSKQKKTVKVCESNAGKDDESKKMKGPPDEEPCYTGENVVIKQKKGQQSEEPSNVGGKAASKRKKGPLDEELSGDVNRFGKGNKGYKIPKSAKLGNQLN